MKNRDKRVCKKCIFSFAYEYSFFLFIPRETSTEIQMVYRGTEKILHAQTASKLYIIQNT